MAEHNSRTYRIGEFARLAGVTVRALRHYERMGLLRPQRTDADYRVFVEKDLAIVTQIVALLFIGFPLTGVKRLLKRSAPELANALGIQRRLLEEKRRMTSRVIEAVTAAELRLRSGQNVEPSLFHHIIEVIHMQNDDTQWQGRYDVLLKSKTEQVTSMTPERRSALGVQWSALVRDVQTSLDAEPSSPEAQALATRWLDLLRLFAPGDKADGATMAALAGDERGSASACVPSDSASVWDFLKRAVAARA